MARYKLTIEYDGGAFAGWQRQQNAPSVQQAIEEAFYGYAQEEVTLQCAGRTDAGVHARGQVAHVDLQTERTPFSMMQGIHHHLDPNPISILEIEQVSEEFHARFSALTRKYVYYIVNRPARPALDAKRAWHIYRQMDVDAMREAAKLFIGTHDFTSFRAAACQSNSPVKTLDKLSIEQQGENIFIYAEAKSFLHNQVRNLTGALAHVGTGKWTLHNVQEALDAKDRKKGPVTAPAHGLTFLEVTY